MTNHEIVHSLHFIAYQIIEAKKYQPNVYAQEHLDSALNSCTKLVQVLGMEITQAEEEKV